VTARFKDVKQHQCADDPAEKSGLSRGSGAHQGRLAGGNSVATDVKIPDIGDFKNVPSVGCGIVGPNAGDLIAEAALAIEMGADATDIGATIHPHPTLSETIGMAAEAFEGTITDLYMPKKKAH
jgi:dihydrolipoamide dehydrogenase